jgi:hypothetical protein
VRRGRRLRPLPDCSQAFIDGDITGAQVDVITALRTPPTEGALARDEETLVGQVSTLPFRTFVRVAEYWKQLADPDGAETDDQERRAGRDVYLDQSFGGMWLGKITLDPISGAIVGGELERLEQEMFKADWSEAGDRLGHDPTVAGLARTPGQRRADALVEMATRSQMALSDSRRPFPLFSVLIDREQLRGRVCELADGTVLAPGSHVPWLDSAVIERVVFAPDRRVEVSNKARVFSGATRRAIALRDRSASTLTATSRRRPARRTTSSPGSTVDPQWKKEENGQMLCQFHNLQKNGRPPPDD